MANGTEVEASNLDNREEMGPHAYQHQQDVKVVKSDSERHNAQEGSQTSNQML